MESRSRKLVWFALCAAIVAVGAWEFSLHRERMAGERATMARWSRDSLPYFALSRSLDLVDVPELRLARAAAAERNLIYDVAARDYKAAIAQGRAGHDMHFDYQYALFASGQLDSALAEALEGERQNSSDSRYFWMRPWIYQQRKDFDSAVDAYTRLIALDSRSYGSFIQRGECHLKAGRCDSAVADFEHAVAMETSGFWWPRYTLWKGYLAAGRGARAAQTALSQINSKGWKDTWMPLVVAQAALGFRQAGLNENARRILGDALALDQPGDSRFAVLRYLAGNLSESAFFSCGDGFGDTWRARSFAAIDLYWRGEDSRACELLSEVARHGDTGYWLYESADAVMRFGVRPLPASATNSAMRIGWKRPVLGDSVARVDSEVRRRRIESALAAADSGWEAAAVELLAFHLDHKEHDAFLRFNAAMADTLIVSTQAETIVALRVRAASALAGLGRHDEALALVRTCPSPQGAPHLAVARKLMSHYAYASPTGVYPELRKIWSSRVSMPTLPLMYAAAVTYPSVFLTIALAVAASAGGFLLSALVVLRRRGIAPALVHALPAAGACLILQILLAGIFGLEREVSTWAYMMSAFVRDVFYLAAGILLARAAGTGRFRESGPLRYSVAVAGGAAACLLWTAVLTALVMPAESALIREFMTLYAGETRLVGGEIQLLIQSDRFTLPAAILVVLAAAREEILCRGLFLPFLYLTLGAGRVRIGGTSAWTLASLAVGAVWALAHAGMVEPEWWKALQVLGLAGILGEMMRRYGLISAILTHGALNLASVILGKYFS